MSTRTQVYFSEQQRKQIDELRRKTGKSLAEIVRDALDRYLAGDRPDAASALDATFGASRELKVPPRAEWTRRG